MKITLGNFVLAAGGDESPEGLRLNGQIAVQEAAYLRAALAMPLARGNRANTLTFSITREHATYAVASGYLFVHAATMPTSGTLTVTTEDAEGSVIVFTATASVAVSDQGSQLGVTTTHQYTLRCGPITGGSLALTPP